MKFKKQRKCRTFVASSVIAVLLALTRTTNAQKLLSKWNDPLFTQSKDRIYSDLWGFESGGRKIILLGHYLTDMTEQVVHFIDVSTPTTPYEIFTWRPPAGNVDFRSVFAHKGYAYLATNRAGGGASGVYMLDARDLGNIHLVSQVNHIPGGHDHVHNVWVEAQGNDDFMYTCSVLDNKTIVFNVTDPSRPVRKAVIVAGTSYDTAHEPVVRNNKLYVSYIGTQKTGIFDVSQIAQGKWRKLYFGYTNGGHCAFPSPDGKRMVTTKEKFGGTARVWDITNPTKPLLLSEFKSANPPEPSASAPPSTVKVFGDFLAVDPHHAYFTEDGTLWISWYQGGVAMMDMSNPKDPKIIKRYDTYSGSDLYGLAGCWGVYPFFGKNLIAVSDISSGLILLDFT